jgi:hypothetical protein
LDEVPSASQIKKDVGVFALTDLFLLGNETWSDEKFKKHCLVQNPQNIGLVDTVFEEVINDMSFIETGNYFRSHTIRHDQQNKEKAAIKIHNIKQYPSAAKMDKVKKVLALINELQIRDSGGSDVEADDVPTSKPTYANWHKYLQRFGRLFP